MHMIVEMTININIKLKGYLTLILDRLGGTLGGEHDTDVKTSGYALHGDIYLCGGATGGMHGVFSVVTNIGNLAGIFDSDFICVVLSLIEFCSDGWLIGSVG